MTNISLPKPHLLKEFNVSQPKLIAETNIAKVWHVLRSDSSDAVLKVYRGSDMLNEGPGFEFLKSKNGNGAAYIYQVNDNCALMEWLDGPSLGDMTRDGDDHEAAKILVNTAAKLHATKSVDVKNWPRLEHWGASLLTIQRGAACSELNWKNFQFSCDLARTLLDNQTDICALHGDLHHDNILLGNRGYCSIDAKGVVGDRGYELANAFRNPEGVPNLVKSPDRFRFLLSLWSKEFKIDKQHMLDWAIAKTAFSMMWRNDETLDDDPDFEYLDMIISLKSNSANFS